MTLLILGVALWAGTHFFSAFAVERRANIIEKQGLKRYMGMFTLAMLIALALIIFGWKQTIPTPLYIAPYELRHLTMLGTLIAFILFVASYFPRTRIKRFIRHPMLEGFCVWAAAHLLSNGEIRSVILFGGLLAWGVIMLIKLTSRDKHKEKPQPGSWLSEALILVIGATLYFITAKYLHGFLSGIPLM